MVDRQKFAQQVSFIKNKYNLSHYEVLQRFIFERFLERISVSKFKNNFILKGGLLLSIVFGIDNRTTRDIDASILGLNVNELELTQIIKEICLIDISDQVILKIISYENIRDNDKYGGIRYHLLGIYNDLKIYFEVDISTGDVITYSQLDFKLNSLFENKVIYLNTYNTETIFAEKLETILRRGAFNSRMKDFYDIYIILNKLKNDTDNNLIKKAIINTFKNRESLSYLKDYKIILDGLKYNEKIIYLWNKYCNNYRYAKEINFLNIIDDTETFLNKLLL